MIRAVPHVPAYVDDEPEAVQVDSRDEFFAVSWVRQHELPFEGRTFRGWYLRRRHRERDTLVAVYGPSPAETAAGMRGGDALPVAYILRGWQLLQLPEWKGA